MHNSLKLSLVPILCILLFGCSQSADITYIDKSYKTDKVTVELQLPQFKSLKNKGFESEVNEEISQVCMNFLSKFKTASDEISSPSVFTSETKKYENGNITSLITQIDYYTQKPHNNSFRITKNINTDTCCELCLKDLFEGDDYIDFINSTLTAIVEKNPQEYSDLWARPQLSENQDFYITEDSLVVYYPPYELSYYTRGFVEFSIPLSNLSGYMTDDYRQMLLKKS